MSPSYLTLLPGWAVANQQNPGTQRTVLKFKSTLILKKRLADNNKTTTPNLTNNNEESSAFTQVQETIVIHSDKKPVDDTHADQYMLSSQLLSSGSDGQIHDLISFLKRPIVVQTGTWTTSNTFNVNLATINFPDDYLNIPIITNKVKGFLGFRGTLKVRLQINTNRFQQGRLVLSFFPQADLAPDKYANLARSALFYTQLPHVDFDASTDSEVILEVPFVNTNLYFNLRSGLGQMGTVGLWVYSPLIAVTGENNADFTIWASFEDIKLDFPTIPSGFIAQAGSFGKSRRKKTDPSTAEQSGAGDGPISAVFTNLAKTADAVARIPLLSSIAAPASWFFSASAIAASAFGFSNPLNTMKQQVVVQAPMSRSINSTGQDMSQNLGLFEDNSIEILPGFTGTDRDEMALNHILSIPTFFFLQTWSDTVAAGDTLFNISLAPAAFGLTGANFQYDTNPAHVVATTYNSPLAYVSNLFAYYRGSIRLTFKIVKTEFHSGRLLVGFSPSVDTDPSHTNGDMDYIHREIIDIRTSNEVTMVFPYASTRPWLRTNLPYGQVWVNVLNDLRAPSTVSNTLNVLVEVSTASDFEFAVPTALTAYPVLFSYGTSPPTIVAKGVEEMGKFIAEAGENLGEQSDGFTQPVENDASIGTGKIIYDGMKSAAYCIGEKVMSLRQLMKRAYPTIFVGECTVIDFFPHLNMLPLNAAAFIGNGIPCQHTYIEVLFAYYRGSTRLRQYNYDHTKGTLRTFTANTINSEATAIQQNGAYVSAACGYPVVIGNANIYPFSEVQVPYYSQTHCSSVQYNPTPSVSYGDFPRGRAVFLSSGSLNGTIITRQYGDDYSAGFFTGTLPVIPLNTTTFPSITRV